MEDSYGHAIEQALRQNCSDIVYSSEFPVACEYPIFYGVLDGKQYTCEDNVLIADLYPDAVQQKRLVSYTIIILGSIIDIMTLKVFSAARLLAKKPDTVDKILLMKLPAGFFLSLRAIDFRGFGDIITYKMEVLFSGIVNVLYFAMALTLIEGWTVIIHLTRSNGKSATFFARLRRYRFWGALGFLIFGNVIISLLDIFESFGELPWWLKGSEKTTKGSYGGIVQICINVVILAVYCVDADRNSYQLIKTLTNDGSTSESSKQTVAVIRRYMRMILLGLSFVILFYFLGLLGQIPIVMKLEDQRFLVGQNYPPCSGADYIGRDVGGFMFLFLYLTFSLVIFRSRRRTLKQEKKKRIVKIDTAASAQMVSTKKKSSSGDTLSGGSSGESNGGSVESSIGGGSSISEGSSSNFASSMASTGSEASVAIASDIEQN